MWMEGFHAGQSLYVFSRYTDRVRGRMGTRKEVGIIGGTMGHAQQIGGGRMRITRIQ
jgi:hypothetical protein